MRVVARWILGISGIWIFALGWVLFMLFQCMDVGTCATTGFEGVLFSTALALPCLLSALIPDRWNKAAFCVRGLSWLQFGLYGCVLGFLSWLDGGSNFSQLFEFRNILGSLLFILIHLSVLVPFAILSVALYRQIRPFCRKDASIKAAQASSPETPAACASPDV